MAPRASRSSRRVLALVGFCLAFVAPASARISYGTISVDDASTLWEGVWEASAGIDAGGGYGLNGARIDLLRVPTQLRWGWKERTEVGFFLPFSFQDASRQEFTGSGISDVKAAIKYQMNRDEGNRPASAAELLLGWGPDAAVGSHSFSLQLNYAISKSFGDGRSAAHGNLGYTLFGSNRDDVFNWGAAFERKMGTTWRWSAAASSGVQLIPGMKKDVVLEGGLTKEFSTTSELGFSLGAGVTKESPDWQARMLFKKEFGDAAGAATRYRMAEWSAPPPPSSAVIIHRGEAAMRIGDYAEAIAAYREAVEKDPEAVSAWNNLGIAYFKSGDPAKALESYEKALTVSPDNADIYFNAGLAHYRLGNLIEARRSFARALELKPDHSLARANLQSLGGVIGK